MAKKRPPPAAPPWSYRDDVLSYTCHLAALMARDVGPDAW